MGLNKDIHKDMDIPLSYPEPHDYYCKRDRGESIHMIFIDGYWYNLAWCDNGEFHILRAKYNENGYYDTQPWEFL